MKHNNICIGVYSAQLKFKTHYKSCHSKCASWSLIRLEKILNLNMLQIATKWDVSICSREESNHDNFHGIYQSNDDKEHDKHK